MATSLTIDPLDDNTLRRLEAEARRRGLDVSSMAAELLKAGLELPQRSRGGAAGRTLKELAGTWSRKEADHFLATISDLEQVDEQLWQ